MQLAIDNTSSRQQELCVVLRKKFAIKLAIDIQQFMLIEPIAPNKIGICFKKNLHLTQEQKSLLRKSLYFVYGQSVAIVNLPNTKIQTVKTITPSPLSTAKAISSTPATPKPKTQWHKVRTNLVEVYGEDLVQASCGKLDITEKESQITFTGNDIFTEIVEGKFGATLNHLASKYNLQFVFKGKIPLQKKHVLYVSN